MELDIGGQPFDLKLSLTMGQAFRWQEKEGWYSGVVGGVFIKIRQTRDGKVEFRSSQPEESTADLLRSYFRLDDDIEAIYAEICRDRKVAELVKLYPGLRILRQEPWECLVAYLCSANNNIRRIGQIVEEMSKKFGDSVSLDGETRRSFPTPAKLDKAGESELERLALGLRQRHIGIYQAAQKVTQGSLNLDDLRGKDYAPAKKELMNLYGVGPKIADCVLLFSLDKLEAFPIDTWISRALVEWLFPDLKPPEGRKLRDSDLRKLRERARQHFGRYRGYANQYLFHGAMSRGAKQTNA